MWLSDERHVLIPHVPHVPHVVHVPHDMYLYTTYLKKLN